MASLRMLLNVVGSFILDGIVAPARLFASLVADDDADDAPFASLFVVVAPLPVVVSFFFFCFSFVGVIARGVIISALLEPSSLENNKTMIMKHIISILE